MSRVNAEDGSFEDWFIWALPFELWLFLCVDGSWPVWLAVNVFVGLVIGVGAGVGWSWYRIHHAFRGRKVQWEGSVRDRKTP